MQLNSRGVLSRRCPRANCSFFGGQPRTQRGGTSSWGRAARSHWRRRRERHWGQRPAMSSCWTICRCVSFTFLFQTMWWKSKYVFVNCVRVADLDWEFVFLRETKDWEPLKLRTCSDMDLQNLTEPYRLEARFRHGTWWKPRKIYQMEQNVHSSSDLITQHARRGGLISGKPAKHFAHRGFGVTLRQPNRTPP